MGGNNSIGVQNRIKTRSIVIAAAIYLPLIFFSFGLAAIPLIFLWCVGYFISKREIELFTQNSISFRKNYPFRHFGAVFGNFTHVFHHGNSLENEIASAVEGSLRERTPISNLSQVAITDIDENLYQHESQCFWIAKSAPTRRGTIVTLVLRFSAFGLMRSIQWWVLGGGYIDRDKRFNFVAYTPMLIWFWIIPYLRKNYDMLSRVRTVYGSAYDDFEVQINTRSLHEVVFNSLISELEKNGIDTSDLKLQREQVMNLTVSGGHVNIGNMVQSSMSKITANIRK